jgi:hypothetical protein
VAAKKTNWKNEARRLQGEGVLPDPGVASLPGPRPESIILAPRTRHSVGNSSEGFLDTGPVDLDHVLSMLSINMKDRVKNAKKGRPPGIDIRTRAQKMKGLFGGGR